MRRATSFFNAKVGRGFCATAACLDKPAAASAESQKSFFKATDLIGYVHSIDGTIATVIPAAGNPGVAYNTIIQIQVSASVSASPGKSP